MQQSPSAIACSNALTWQEFDAKFQWRGGQEFSQGYIKINAKITALCLLLLQN